MCTVQCSCRHQTCMRGRAREAREEPHGAHRVEEALDAHERVAADAVERERREEKWEERFAGEARSEQKIVKGFERGSVRS